MINRAPAPPRGLLFLERGDDLQDTRAHPTKTDSGTKSTCLDILKILLQNINSPQTPPISTSACICAHMHILKSRWLQINGEHSALLMFLHVESNIHLMHEGITKYNMQISANMTLPFFLGVLCVQHSYLDFTFLVACDSAHWKKRKGERKQLTPQIIKSF